MESCRSDERSHGLTVATEAVLREVLCGVFDVVLAVVDAGGSDIQRRTGSVPYRVPDTGGDKDGLELAIAVRQCENDFGVHAVFVPEVDGSRTSDDPHDLGLGSDFVNMRSAAVQSDDGVEAGEGLGEAEFLWQCATFEDGVVIVEGQFEEESAAVEDRADDGGRWGRGYGSHGSPPGWGCCRIRWGCSRHQDTLSFKGIFVNRNSILIVIILL